MKALIILALIGFVAAEDFSLVDIHFDFIPDAKCVKKFKYDGQEIDGCVGNGGYYYWCSYDEVYTGEENRWGYCKRAQLPNQLPQDDFDKMFVKVGNMEKELSKLVSSPTEQRKCQCMANINTMSQELKGTKSILADHQRRLKESEILSRTITAYKVFAKEVGEVWPRIRDQMKAIEVKVVAKPLPKVTKGSNWTKDCSTSVCYLFYRKRGNQMQAKAACEAIKSDGGYHLAVPSGQANTIWLRAKGREYKTPKFWVDGYDGAREGVWRDFKNRVIPRSNLDWYRGEPNNWGNEDCIHIGWFSNQQLNDLRCNANLDGFVCSNSK